MLNLIFKKYSKNLLFHKQQISYEAFYQIIKSKAEKLVLFDKTFLAYPIYKESPSIDYFASLLASLHCQKVLFPIYVQEDTLKLKRFCLENSLTLYPTELKSNAMITDLIFSEHSPFLALSTSGSTGAAKTYVYTLENNILSAQASIDFYQMNAKEKHLLQLPLHHIAGNMVFWRTFLSGGCLYEADDEIQKQYDYVSLVPLQLRRQINNSNLKYFKAIILGGEKCPQDLINSINEKKLPVSLTYGMTESCAQIAASKPSHVEYQCAGEILNHRKISFKNKHLIIESNANPCYQFSKGQLIKINNKILITNDIAELKNEKLYIFNRSDDIFISGGENVSPNEILSKVSDHLHITYKKIIPVLDLDYGEVPAFFYKGTCPAEEIYQQLKNNLPSYKIPKYFINLNKEVPQSSLKFSKNELLDIWQKKKSIEELNIFIHGFLGNEKDFNFIKSDHTLHLKTPGHSDYENFSFQSLDEYINALIKTYRLNQMKKIKLWGYSQGGRIAIALASKLKLLPKLILFSPHPGLINKEEKKLRYQNDLKLFENHSIHSFLDYWYKQELFSFSESEQIQVKKDKVKNNLISLKNSLKLFSLGNQPSYWDFLSKYQGEIHYIYGELDFKYKNIALELQNLNKNCIIHEIKKSGHNPLVFHQKNILELNL